MIGAMGSDDAKQPIAAVGSVVPLNSVSLCDTP